MVVNPVSSVPGLPITNLFTSQETYINVSTELEMTSDARQDGGESWLRQTLQVRVTSDTQKIQSFDSPK